MARAMVLCGFGCSCVCCGIESVIMSGSKPEVASEAARDTLRA